MAITPICRYMEIRKRVELPQFCLGYSMHFNAGEDGMRSFFAFILGIVVTVGAAYIHDVVVASAATKPLVNWEQVGEVTAGALDSVRAQWNRLTK
jgi:hypothetical protein